MRYCGIDVGKNGAIAFINTLQNEQFVCPFPKIGKEIDERALAQLIIDHEPSYIMIEQVHALFGSGAKATFEFGQSYGLARGLAIMYGCVMDTVKPKEWQKEMHQGVQPQYKASLTGETNVKDTKLMSQMVAKQLFPNIDFTPTSRSTKEHDGMHDAMLIAEYCRRKFS